MKKETKDRIQKALANLERVLDVVNERKAAREAFLFSIPKKKYLS